MLEFYIPSMSCGHCVQSVKQALQAADPQARVEVDLASHQVRVDSQADRQSLVSVLSQAGYAPR